jgi:hypothetical protein
MSVFRIDSTSLLMREYVRKQSQGGGSSLQIITGDASDDFIDINETNFFAENASFVNGTVIVGEADDDHAVFGASNGDRIVTTSDTYNLLKGTYLSIKSVCGVSTGGSIELLEDPDGSEDLVIEVMLGESEFVRLPGRITERNSSTSAYIEYRFLMTEDDGDYFIRIKQTRHSGSERDYYAFKNLRININTSLYDPVSKITLF